MLEDVGGYVRGLRTSAYKILQARRPGCLDLCWSLLAPSEAPWRAAAVVNARKSGVGHHMQAVADGLRWQRPLSPSLAMDSLCLRHLDQEKVPRRHGVAERSLGAQSTVPGRGDQLPEKHENANAIAFPVVLEEP